MTTKIMMMMMVTCNYDNYDVENSASEADDDCAQKQWIILLFLLSLLLRLSLSVKFGLRPKISQKWKSFFRLDLVVTQSEDWTEQLLSTELI